MWGVSMEHYIIEEYKNRTFSGMYEILHTQYSQIAMQKTLLGYYAGMFMGLNFTDAVTGYSDKDTETDELAKFVCGEYKKDQTIGLALMGILNYIFLYYEWKKKKQIFKFDSALIGELSDTDVDFDIPYDIFSRMPYQTVCIDISDNPEICDKIQADSFIVRPCKIEVMLEDGVHSYFVLLVMTYKNGQSRAVRGITFPNTSDGIRISTDQLSVSLENEDQTVTGDAKLQTAIIMQTILYLCSFEPDIHETSVSKAKQRQAKQNKKSTDKPIREFEVGVRFGEAFRSWTAGKLGAEKSIGTGSHKRPHMRRAHWHRFWTGKRNSDERKLIIKWVSECFCGIAEGETDKMSAVQHKVRSIL